MIFTFIDQKRVTQVKKHTEPVTLNKVHEIMSLLQRIIVSLSLHEFTCAQSSDNWILTNHRLNKNKHKILPVNYKMFSVLLNILQKSVGPTLWLIWRPKLVVLMHLYLCYFRKCLQYFVLKGYKHLSQIYFVFLKM